MRVFALTIECSMVDLNNWLEGLIDSFWISTGTPKIKELSESQPVSSAFL